MIVLGDASYIPIYVPGDYAGNWVTRGRLRDVAGWGELDRLLGQVSRVNPTWQVEVNRSLKARHRSRYNVFFADGHIEYLKQSKLYERSDQALKRWARHNEPLW
jgi:prepilin-type processing-associated H-X9-DG protein